MNSVTSNIMIGDSSTLKFVAETNLPTTHGTLVVRSYRNETTEQEPIAIVSGNITDHQATHGSVPVRVHDACFTSEVLGSLKCDCKAQLDTAIEYIQEHNGIVIYLHQEGRGIGLANKIAAYALQEQGMDTVDANRHLHLPDDARVYHDAVAILKDLNIHTIDLLTNNPRKLEHLKRNGISIRKRLPIQVPASNDAKGYLNTKRLRMGHLLNPES